MVEMDGRRPMKQLWGMGEVGRKHGDEGKRVDGILKQVDERQKQMMGDKRNWKGTLGNEEDLEKGAAFDLGLRERRMGKWA